MLLRRLKFAPFVLAIAVGALVLALSLASASDPTSADAAATSHHSIRWHKAIRRLPGKNGGFTAISCAAVNMCLAADATGHVVWSKKPWKSKDKYWKMGRIDKDRGGLTGISCPIKRFCAAVDGSGHVTWTTSPTGGAKKWHKPVRIDRMKLPGGGWAGLSGIACASPKLCVAVDNAPNGEVIVSRNPTGGSKTWHRAKIAVGHLTSVACPSTSLCIASGNRSYYSTRVYGSARDWHLARGAPGGGVLSAVTCARKSTTCIAVGYNNTSPGVASASNQPAGGRWVFEPVESYPPGPTEGLLNAVGCPTSSFCVALDTSDAAYTTNTPLARGGWSPPHTIRPHTASVSAELSCTLKICVAVDSRGLIIPGSVRK